MELDDRIVILEAKYRRLRAWLVACVALGAMSWLVGFNDDARPIRTSSLELVDSNGRVLGALRATNHDGAELVFFDKQDHTLAWLGAGHGEEGSGSGLRLGGNGREEGIELVAGSNVRRMQLYDLQGNERIEIKVGQYGAPGLEKCLIGFDDGDGNRRMQLGTAPVSTARPPDRRSPPEQMKPVIMPYLDLADSEGTSRARLAVWADGLPSFDLWDDDAAKSFSVPKN